MKIKSIVHQKSLFSEEPSSSFFQILLVGMLPFAEQAGYTVTGIIPKNVYTELYEKFVSEMDGIKLIGIKTIIRLFKANKLPFDDPKMMSVFKNFINRNKKVVWSYFNTLQEKRVFVCIENIVNADENTEDSVKTSVDKLVRMSKFIPTAYIRRAVKSMA